LHRIVHSAFNSDVFVTLWILNVIRLSTKLKDVHINNKLYLNLLLYLAMIIDPYLFEWGCIAWGCIWENCQYSFSSFSNRSNG